MRVPRSTITKEDLTNELKEIRLQINVENSKLEAIQRHVAEAVAGFAARESKADAKERTIEEKEKKFRQKELQNEHAIKEQEKKIAENNAILNNLESDIANAREVFSKEKKENSEKFVQLLRQTNDQLKHCNNLTKSIEGKNELIESLNKSIDAKEKTILSLNSDIEKEEKNWKKREEELSKKEKDFETKYRDFTIMKSRLVLRYGEKYQDIRDTLRV